jgi:hypothetical protein
MYYKNSIQLARESVKEFENSPQFTDRDQSDEEILYDEEDSCYEDEEGYQDQ